MTKILLITITGHDKPGLTSAFAQTLAESNATLLDIGQAVIHDALALGLMVKANPSSSIKIVEAKIQEKARELGVTARLNHVSEGEYRDWVKKQHKQRFIVTLLAPQITAAQLMVVTSVFAAHSLNIDIMDRLSARASASELASRAAREVLAEHENAEIQLSGHLAGADSPAPRAAQLTIFTPLSQPVLEKLREIDLNNLTPLEALNLLSELKKQVQ